MRTISIVICTALLGAAPALAQDQGRTAPWNERAPNAHAQSPAFPEQTRAPRPEGDLRVRAETIAAGLPQLWSLEFLPDGRMLVAAKEGAMHVVGADGVAGPAIDGVPDVDARRQGGLLDIALSPTFADDRLIFFSYSEPRGREGNGTTVARARLEFGEGNNGALSDVSVIFQQMPSYRGTMHYGSRLAFAPDGSLFVTTGERSDRGVRGQSQDLSSGLGKVFRITADGAPYEGNPFIGQSGAQPEIWSFGHRNPQSAIVTETGELWTVEHGPRGGDELNRPLAGRNYGWPAATYGVEYSGSEVGRGLTELEGMEQPVYYWDPVIAPSGMAEYTGDHLPSLDGAFLVGGLVSRGIVVLKLEDGLVVSEDRIDLGARVRDVKVGPDGAVYAVTEARGGPSSIVRLTEVEGS